MTAVITADAVRALTLRYSRRRFTGTQDSHWLADRQGYWGPNGQPDDNKRTNDRDRGTEYARSRFGC